MGYEYLARAEVEERLCGVAPVRKPGQYLRFGGVGLEIADGGEHALSVRPILEEHLLSLAARVPEIALHIHREIAAARELVGQPFREVAVDEPAELPNSGGDIAGDIGGREGIALRQTYAAALLLVLGEVLVLDGSGAGGGQADYVLAGEGEHGEPVLVGGGEFGQRDHAPPQGVSRGGRVDHGAAHLHGEKVAAVYVVVERHMPDDRKIVSFHVVFVLLNPRFVVLSARAPGARKAASRSARTLLAPV